MNLKSFFINKYNEKLKINKINIKAAGVCLQRKAMNKKIGIKNQ